MENRERGTSRSAHGVQLVIGESLSILSGQDHAIAKLGNRLH
jgi:hypothetical protein